MFSLNEDFELSNGIEYFDKKRVPFGLKYEGNEKAQFRQLSDWIENRGLPRSRSDLVYIQKDLKARNSKELAFGSYALNLSDQYWAHKKDSEPDWEKVNFFDNKFCERNGIKDVKKKLDDMIAVDYIIGNTDRHTVISG